MTIGSLFSGVGGLELGLEWAGLGPVLWQVEKCPKCRAVLSRHWPEVERYEDVCTVDGAALAPVDLLCGGFPCQDISSAGKRAGLAGARSGLWYEFARIVAQCRPRFVVVENVAGGASRWVDAVRGGLGKLGYASLPVPVEAADVGAPHRRARVFIVAANSERKQPGDEPGGGGGAVWAGTSEPGDHGTQEPLADSNVRRQHAESEHGQVGSASSALGDSLQHGRSRAEGSGIQGRPESSPRGWWASEPSVCRVVDRAAGGLDGRERRSRIRMLGNSVVPQCAEVIGRVIWQLLEQDADLRTQGEAC